MAKKKNKQKKGLHRGRSQKGYTYSTDRQPSEDSILEFENTPNEGTFYNELYEEDATSAAIANSPFYDNKKSRPTDDFYMSMQIVDPLSGELVTLDKMKQILSIVLLLYVNIMVKGIRVMPKAGSSLIHSSMNLTIKPIKISKESEI